MKLFTRLCVQAGLAKPGEEGWLDKNKQADIIYTSHCVASHWPLNKGEGVGGNIVERLGFCRDVCVHKYVCVFESMYRVIINERGDVKAIL